MKVTGLIIRRRCLGKNLAFCEIQRDDEDVHADDVDEQDAKMQVVFRRQSTSWNRERDDTFPTSKSSLAYGSRISLDLVASEQHKKGQEEAQTQPVRSGSDQSNEKTQPKWEVRSWEVLVDAKKEALTLAEKDGGISCTKYLKSRKSSSLEALRKCPPKEKVAKMSRQKHVQEPEKRISLNTIQLEFSHGDKKAKSLRSKVFAKWILDKFGTEHLTHGSGILDIAGGKGQLSVELAVMGQILCHVIDPLLRKRGTNGLSKKQMKRIEKAKEDIIDVALRFHKSVAIVPCCVFPTRIFPMRQLRYSGKPVRSYEEFLQYLLEKDERLQMEALDFEGRNNVIFLRQKVPE